MIQDRRQIKIKASPKCIFDLIETMPNKFPIYKVLETKPFFFLRILIVYGLRKAIAAASVKKPCDVLKLNVGDSIGPFTLIESEKPTKYWFTLRSLFFNCKTGYYLEKDNDMTTMYFDLISENPSFKEKTWWFFVKPFHVVFARKVLIVIKRKVESQ